LFGSRTGRRGHPPTRAWPLGVALRAYSSRMVMSLGTRVAMRPRRWRFWAKQLCGGKRAYIPEHAVPTNRPQSTALSQPPFKPPSRHVRGYCHGGERTKMASEGGVSSHWPPNCFEHLCLEQGGTRYLRGRGQQGGAAFGGGGETDRCTRLSRKVVSTPGSASLRMGRRNVTVAHPQSPGTLGTCVTDGRRLPTRGLGGGGKWGTVGS
jgi:hypothetical protein